jgi:hypothetical protein
MLKGLGRGYDYDVVNTEVILTRMSVKEGRLVLPDGMSYALLMLPDQAQMPLEVLEKIRDLVGEGATVVGPRPTTVPGLEGFGEKNRKLNEIAGKLWGKIDGKGVRESSYGKGRVIDGLTAEEVLQKMGIPADFTFSGPSEIDFIHRTVPNGELYFLRNPGDHPVVSTCEFRVPGKYPELWDPSTGKISRLEEYTRRSGRTSVRLELPAHGSAVVFFNTEDRTDIPGAARDSVVEQREITGPWAVSFPPNWGAPPEVTFTGLISWTDSNDEGIKYFSGTATYTNTFVLDGTARGKRILLDLGEMRDVAEVFVNGKSAGILWTKPFSVDIGPLVREGRNDLTVEIVNMWVNRLVGDKMSAPAKPYCRTNHYYMGSEIWQGGDETYRLQASGLLGPVIVQIRGM